MYYAGIDLGSSFAKVVIIDGQKNVVGRAIRRTGIAFDSVANLTLTEALQTANLTRAAIDRICVTGVGRRACTFGRTSQQA